MVICTDSFWTNFNACDLHAYISSGEVHVPHSNFARCSILKSADQTITPTTWTKLSFDLESKDVGDMHDNVTNNTRITIPVNNDGEYRIFYQAKCQATDKSAYETRVILNDTLVLEGTCQVGIGSKDSSFLCLNLVSPTFDLVAGNYLELQFYHDNGSNQSVYKANTFFGVQRIY